jgi:hypothetical protein
LLGKNFLKGRSSPTRLKMTNTINGRSIEELVSKVKLSATKPKKYAGTNHKAYQAHLSPRLYAVIEMTVIRKAKPMSDKPPLMK